MPIPSLRWFCRLIASAALALIAMAYTIELDHAGFPGIEPVAAYAKNSGGGNGNGNNGNGNGNNGNSNSNSGNSNGNDSGDSDDSGDDASDAGNASSQASRVNRATGDKVTVRGNVIEVVHPDGISEKIEAGRFRMKDAQGRTIIDRALKASDVTRLKAL
ncbi:hypothetical protein [Mesorhizobium metallidurans]|uniref:hypothetical protein n=1 Tax=Mesorhizobium metallidurans TaxID=489722 RepID=UPI000345B8FB|nr:hypothetical protein [Mesorhizobium metallidurans]